MTRQREKGKLQNNNEICQGAMQRWQLNIFISYKYNILMYVYYTKKYSCHTHTHTLLEVERQEGHS